MSSILYYSAVSVYPREAHFSLDKNYRDQSAERIDRSD